MKKQEKSKTILIVGAGFTGLGTAKYALEQGFEPFIIEQKSEIGGIWNPKTGHTWESMTTNLSKFNVAYKDYPWPQDSPTFPNTVQFYNYMKSYAEHFNLFPYINFNCSIISLQKVTVDGDVQYKAIWLENGIEKQYVFPYVALAAGIFSTPHIPKFKGLDRFKGEVIHSSSYKQGEYFKGKKVLTIGSSYTGIQLTSDISFHCQKVIHCYRNPFWVLPHFVKVSPTRKIPVDAALFTRSYHKLPQMNHQETIFYLNNLCHSLSQDQQDLQNLKIRQEDFDEPASITISSHYIEQVRKQKIAPVRVKDPIQFTENAVVADGVEYEVDIVVMCTGYHNSVKFLDEQIKKAIQYDENQIKQPYILYKEVVHPQYPNLLFLGMYKAVQIPACELHAQLAIKIFCGKVKLPSKEEMLKGMSEQRRFRTLPTQPQAPHIHYIEYNDQIAELMGQNFNLEELKQISTQTYQMFIQLPALQTQFYYNTQKIEQQIHYTSKILDKMSLPI